MTRHVHAVKGLKGSVQICQCPECKGQKPEPLCRHTRELFAVETVTIEGPKEQGDLFNAAKE